MASYLSPSDLDVICREANIAAARLARQLQLPRHERDDLRQELLVDLIARLKAFDPSRGTLGAFAGRVVAHQASRLASRVRRERALIASISLDDPVHGGDWTIGDTIAESDGYLALHGQSTDRVAEAERRLDLARALSWLGTAERQLSAHLADRSPDELSRQGGGARATVYRRVRDLRLQFLAADIAATA